MRSLLILLLLANSAFAQTSSSLRLERKLRHGDIVFQYIPCGELCIAIAETTPCIPGRPFNHCGIIVKSGDSVSVLEAIGKNVHTTPLAVFMGRDTGSTLYIGRVRRASGLDPAAAVSKAYSFEGRPYDDVFLPGADALYCSELVYEAYQKAGKPFFGLQPMTFKSPRSGQTFPAWEQYYRDIKAPIPEGLPGINPCAIANDSRIRLMAVRKR